MRWALLLISSVAMAQTPSDVVELVRTAAEALALKNPTVFFDKFDSNMQGYAQLHDEVETLLSAAEVGSAVEIVSDDGDDNTRSLQLDWLLEVTDHPPKRAILKCRIERQGKHWKFIALDPIDFFKY